MALFDNYSERISITGLGTKDGLTKRSKDELRNEFERTINYHLLNAIEVDGTEVTKRIHTYREQNKVDRILTHPDEFMKDGTILLDLLGYDWIVIRAYWRGEVNQVADIMQLRHRIKWMYGNTVVESRCDVVSEPTIRGITNNQFFTIPDNMIYLMMQGNDAHKTIKRDKRLMVLGTPYKVTKVDKTSFNDVMILHLLEDLMTPSDTEEVCDYIEPVVQNTTYISGPESIVKDRYRLYTMYVNEVLENETVNWSIDNAADFNLTVENNQAKIHATGDIGSTAIITGTSINGTATLEIGIRSLL